jgi:hypothetical protein
MNKIAFVVPVLAFSIGVYLLIFGLTAGEALTLLGGRVAMQPKFGTLLGGLGIFAGVIIAIEMFGKTRPKQTAGTTKSR